MFANLRWNHGTSLMYGSDNYISQLKYKPIDHGEENKPGNASIYASNFSSQKKKTNWL